MSRHFFRTPVVISGLLLVMSVSACTKKPDAFIPADAPLMLKFRSVYDAFAYLRRIKQSTGDSEGGLLPQQLQPLMHVISIEENIPSTAALKRHGVVFDREAAIAVLSDGTVELIVPVSNAATFNRFVHKFSESTLNMRCTPSAKAPLAIQETTSMSWRCKGIDGNDPNLSWTVVGKQRAVIVFSADDMPAKLTEINSQSSMRNDSESQYILSQLGRDSDVSLLVRDEASLARLFDIDREIDSAELFSNTADPTSTEQRNQPNVLRLLFRGLRRAGVALARNRRAAVVRFLMHYEVGSQSPRVWSRNTTIKQQQLLHMQHLVSDDDVAIGVLTLSPVGIFRELATYLDRDTKRDLFAWMTRIRRDFGLDLENDLLATLGSPQLITVRCTTSDNATGEKDKKGNQSDGLSIRISFFTQSPKRLRHALLLIERYLAVLNQAVVVSVVGGQTFFQLKDAGHRSIATWWLSEGGVFSFVLGETDISDSNATKRNGLKRYWTRWNDVVRIPRVRKQLSSGKNVALIGYIDTARLIRWFALHPQGERNTDSVIGRSDIFAMYARRIFTGVDDASWTLQRSADHRYWGEAVVRFNDSAK